MYEACDRAVASGWALLMCISISSMCNAVYVHEVWVRRAQLSVVEDILDDGQWTMEVRELLGRLQWKINKSSIYTDGRKQKGTHVQTEHNGEN